MKSVKINDFITWTGVHDEKLRRFDIVLETADGTTYNSFVIKGKDKTVLIDGAKTGFEEVWIETIKEVTPIEDIDVVVIQHSEPDHTSSVNALLEINPDILFYGSTLALDNLKEIVNVPINTHVVKAGETYDLGGLTLQFLITPNVHWPDTIMTYVPELKVLFTCDFLGSHYSSPSILRSELKSNRLYDKYLQEYYDGIMAPMAKFVQRALKQVRALDVEMVLNSHGPVLDYKEAVDSALKKYDEWSTPVTNLKKKIVIAYCSSYGYTRAIAEQFDQSINHDEFDVKTYDIVEVAESKVVNEILTSDAFMIGSPTIMGDVIRPVYDLVNSLPIYLLQGKHATAFGSYGWSGEAVPNLIARLKQLKVKVNDQGFAVRLNPSESELKDAQLFAEQFSASIK